MNWIQYRIAEAQRGETTELDLSTGSKGSSDRLKRLPPEILDLRHLTKLDLSGHDLWRLPKEISRLENLRELYLNRNERLVLPKTLGDMPNLTRLGMSDVISAGRLRFGLPGTLEYLDLSATGLETIPPQILDLPGLRELDLGWNRFDVVPREIELLTSLRSLNFAAVPLRPGDLSRLARSLPLEQLALTAGYDIEVIAEMSNFLFLEDLRLHLGGTTKLAICPEWHALHLKALGVRRPPHETAADIRGIEAFADLTELRLEIPVTDGIEGIWTLKHLKVLELSNTSLATVPSEILEFSDLVGLELKAAGIKVVPKEIEKLRSLGELNLSYNEISQLPEEIGAFSSLTTLRLQGTSLTTMPTSVNQLKRLKRISLAGTQLIRWPGELNGLSALEHVGLRDTRVTEIPGDAVRSLPRLKYLGLERCPVKSPPPEIVDGGTAAIQGYFDALEESQVSRLYEAKLIILGEGDVGKTCLASKLVNPDFDIQQNQKTIETTRGIAVAKWIADTDVSRNFRINIWDFGGQEIYHATHQFFLTKRSLYIFVWEARKDERVEAFEYWLNVVKLLSQASPVLVVQNKSDVRIKEIEQASLRGKFSNIVDFYQVSALTGRGMRELARDVRANIVKLAHVGDPWPQSWSDIRQSLEADLRNYIDYAEYLEICGRRGLDKSQADLLSQYLHDLGVILHFQDDDILRETVILKPEWGTNAVYAVLDTKEVQRRKGRFSRGDLRSIWSRTTHPPDKHTELLQLMMRFELCFPLDGSQEFIAPELLSGDRPEFAWEARSNLRWEYHYTFMPAGILSRFIARNHRTIEGENYWKNGVVLAWEGTRALVTADALSRKIRVAVAGSDQKGTLAVVRHELDHIHKTLNNPDVKQMLPCICAECRTGDPFLFEYSRVVRYREGRKQTMTCDKSLVDVRIDRLLGNVLPEESGRRGPVEVFYSYAHKDEPLRVELEKSLSMMRREGFIQGWRDRGIRGGEKWAEEIDEHIRSAEVILLLVSADFVASDYCWGVELNIAMERHAAGEAEVIPIILRPVDWSGSPFAKLQALPRNAKAVTTWTNQDEAFTDIARGIREVVGRIRS
jgi:internalin A